MCGRFVSPDEAAIERAWHIGRHNNDPFRRSFNVQPASIIPLLKLDLESGELELATARWGLIPHWWKDAKPPNFTFNARVEEAPSKPMWRDALRRARCLVPAEGWYEWREHERSIGAAKGKRYKQPYYIRRRDGRLLCFAGLLSRWAAPGADEPMLTCSILTTAASGPLTAIYDRMPVVLADETHAAWLAPALKDGERAVELARSRAPAEALEHYPVSTLVNNGRADSPELIEPARDHPHPRFDLAR
jgi:putative SOS response-associated peptidase YedK